MVRVRYAVVVAALLFTALLFATPAIAGRSNQIEGTANADHIGGTGTSDRILGLEGDDHLRGWGGDDRLVGCEAVILDVYPGQQARAARRASRVAGEL